MTRRSVEAAAPSEFVPPASALGKPRGTPIQRQTIASMTVEALRERILRRLRAKRSRSGAQRGHQSQADKNLHGVLLANRA